MKIDILMLVDTFFSYLPFFLFIYHSIGYRRKNFFHSNQIHRSILILLISNILKFYFSVPRQESTNDFLMRFLKRTCFFSNNAFPSTHALFYTQYFIYKKNYLNFLLFFIGLLSRIFYKHHTVEQVFWGFFISLVLEFTIFRRLTGIKKGAVFEWMKKKKIK